MVSGEDRDIGNEIMGVRRMEEKYWKQFMCTGSIDDYLQYCRAKNQAEQETSVQGEQDDREHYSNRNDPVGPTDG